MQLSVNTIFASLFISSLMIGCGGSSSNKAADDTGSMDPPSATRFKPMTMSKQIVMQDTTTKLEWVNGTGGCHPMTPGKSEVVALAEALDHCDNLVYASHSDWRVPTPAEIQVFNTEMKEAGITPFYANPMCPRVVGTNDRNTDLSTVNTHNTPPLGTVSAWMDSNAGVRCVRVFN